MARFSPDVPVETLRKRKREATQRLLGDTIGISDGQWRARSTLPGWTRAHVATHLAEGARALMRVTKAALDGRFEELYPNGAARFAAIEDGALRRGLDLQIDLDTSAGELNSYWDSVADWSVPIRLDGRPLELRDLIMIRFREVVLHHVDLDAGFTVDDIEPVPARWLLEFRVANNPRLSPAVRVETESGIVAVLGQGEPALNVTGTDARVWGWVNGRVSPDRVTGADGVRMPPAP